MMTQDDINALAERLLREDTVEVGDVVLVRNLRCDCVIGTDPLEIESVAAYTACRTGCREAVLWALKAARMPSLDKLGVARPVPSTMPMGQRSA